MYIPQYPETERIRNQFDSQEQGILVPYPDDSLSNGSSTPKKAFSLARFIPLLQERIYVVSPFTRSYLVSWITILDSVPELELVSYLPDFLDGLLSVPLKPASPLLLKLLFIQEVPFRPHRGRSRRNREPLGRFPSRDT